MNVSEIRRNIAKKQNAILSALFLGVGEDKYDFEKLDLSKFSIVDLSDFWLDSTGFLGVQAFDEYDFTEYEANNILNGTFFLKDLTETEARRLIAEAKIEKELNFRKYFSETLSEIQDGKYTIVNETARYGSEPERYVMLETEPVIFKTSSSVPYDSIQKIKFVRNTIAHDMPYINGLKLNFYGPNYEITTSKMWLRGLMEEFVFSSINIDASKLYDAIMQRAYENNIQINDNKDIDKVLSLVVDQFDEDIRTNFFRVNNFIKARVALIPDFFDRNLSEQLKIISVLISKNPTYIKYSNETINPSIIYNIIQIISKEIDMRGEKALFEHDDIQTNEINKLIDEHKRLMTEISKCTSTKMRKKLVTALNANEKQLIYHQQRLQNIQRHETSDMNLLDIEELENLPIEVAFNIVCMMGFNALNTSEFYNDLLENVDAYDLSKAQKTFFTKFDLSKFVYKINNKQIKIQSEKDIVFVLNGIRTAFSHGLATYRLPNLKKNEKFNINNLTISLNTRTYSIEGKLIDFFNLFNSPIFYGARPPEIFTGNPNNLVELEEYGEEPDEGNAPDDAPTDGNNPSSFE